MTKRNKKTQSVTVSQDQIRRSVATSTAIETGECSLKIEERLKSNKRRFPNLTLAT